MWQSIINWVTDANAVVNGIVWGWPVIILILGTGLLLSIRTGFLQVCRFGNSMNTTIVPVIRSLGKKSGASPARSVQATLSASLRPFSPAVPAQSSGCGFRRSSAW